MSLEKWVTLKVSNKSYQLHIIEGRLSENGIQSVIVNKIDSSYLNFGEASNINTNKKMKKMLDKRATLLTSH